MNREDVVQAALKIERWCIANSCDKCPFLDADAVCILSTTFPQSWKLAEHLRNRGLKDGSV